MLHFVLVATFFKSLLAVMLSGTAVFLILVVLVQRGRGGGLAGALGGMGGQSAFGAKAGDLFTRITMVVAFFWIVLCMVSVKTLNTDPEDSRIEDSSKASEQETGLAPPAESGDSE